MRQLAVIADIHGNASALEAVLADIEARGISEIVNLGDSLDRWMNPGAVAELLMSHDIPSLLGNDESATDDQLTEAQRQWRDSLPATLELDGIFCCHGTPTSNTTALLEDITKQGVTVASDETIMKRLAGVSSELILCAHTHIPNVVQLASGQLVVNPGSVGLPAYHHDDPVIHEMQTASPHARYALLSKPNDWSIQFIALRYDWQAAADLALKAARPDRAHALLTGRPAALE